MHLSELNRVLSFRRIGPAALGLAMFTFLIFICLVNLGGFHCYLISKGETTNEQMLGRFRKSGGNPENLGFTANIRQLLFGKKKPSLLITSEILCSKES
jgi:hypothetical protein